VARTGIPYPRAQAEAAALGGSRFRARCTSVSPTGTLRGGVPACERRVRCPTVWTVSSILGTLRSPGMALRQHATQKRWRSKEAKEIVAAGQR
jgi:hypothetical protein